MANSTLNSNPQTLNHNENWYDRLDRPRWTPSRAQAIKIWTILYPLIFGSLGYALLRTAQGWYPSGFAALIVANLIFMLAYMPIQVRSRNNLAALLDILAVDATLIVLMITLFPYSFFVPAVQVPYLLWALILTAAQISILRRNGRRFSKRVHRV